jgi:hypothetical protein
MSVPSGPEVTNQLSIPIDWLAAIQQRLRIFQQELYETMLENTCFLLPQEGFSPDKASGLGKIYRKAQAHL